MAFSLRNLKRFPPRASVDFLSRDQRKAHRDTISVLSSLTLALESGAPLSPDQERQVAMLTRSDALDTRINTMMAMLEQTEGAYLTKLAAMAPFDLSAYHELMNPHEPPAHHHYYLCDHLMAVEAGEIATLIVALPPGAAKSTYSSRSFVQWYMGRNPDHRVLAVGHSQKFAEDEFSKPNRNAIDTDTFRLVFPDVELNPMEQGSSFWKLNSWRGSYACRGALAGTSGLRAKIVMADDLFKNAADAMSPVIRENIWRWWTADVMSRRLPGCPVILVNTLWHSEDVPNRLKKLAEEDPESIPQPFKFINIPAQAEEDDPLGRAPGEWLWCSDQQEDGYYSIKDYETKRATMPPSLWSALYLGQPLDKLGDYISEDEFTRYDRPPVNRHGHQIEWTKTVMSIDCAARGADRSDYTAILIFRKHVDGSHYLVDAWRGKETLERVVRIISRLMRFWQVNYAVLEDSGMGIQILDNYQGKLPSPLVPYTPSGKGSKDFRFDAAAPWITAGKVLFPKQGPWIADFINELVAFPNGANDDWVDSFSMYTDHELKTRIGGTKPLRMRV